MLTSKQLEYQRKWEAEHRKKVSEERLLLGKHCPFCSMFLNSEYHKLHPCSQYTHKIRAKEPINGLLTDSEEGMI
jgi:hypothetical protein